jgi:uncharacterized damage-inducible protein DinB
VFTLPGVRKFYDWTHASLTLLLNHLSAIPATDYAKEVPGFGFPTVRAQVIHILNCEGFWIHTLQAIPFDDQDPANWPSVSDARLLQSQVSMRTLNYLSRLSEQNLIAPTQLHFPDGDVAVRTPALILHHILTHAFHHKGQIVSMCRILGYPAPDTDLNQFE